MKTTYKTPKLNKKASAIIDKKDTINTFIREGKDLTKLKEEGIKLKLPL